MAACRCMTFPDKKVDFVLKAVRKCFGPFMKFICKFQEVRT